MNGVNEVRAAVSPSNIVRKAIPGVADVQDTITATRGLVNPVTTEASDAGSASVQTVEPGPGSYFIAMGTSNNVGVTGFRWFLDGALGGFAVANPLPEIQTPAKRLVSADGWQQIAISVDVPAGRGFTFKNGWKFPRDDPDFAIPAWGSTSAAAPNLLRLGTQTNDGAALWPAGARFAIVRMYDRALGVDELRQDYLADRARFGLGAATSAR